ncbi:MAG TPA: hypothetical protein VHS31_14420, partial [Tepidisphaeraceae bacterium]|nr:hypothetical protein [Tepidisphaeraceae bacterium]
VYDDSNQNGKFDSGELFAFIENDSYDFYGLSEGLHHIRVHYKSGAITIPPQQDVIIRPGKQAHANFNLTVAITVTGHCSFAGKGVAGLTIFAEADNNGTLNIGEPSTVTDANGNYTLTAPLNDKLMVAPNKGLRPTSTSPIFIYGEQPVINIPLTAAPSLQLLGFYDDNGNGRRDDGERLSTGDVTILCNLSGGDYFKKQMSYFEPPTAGVYTMSHIAESSGGISTNRIPTTPLPITITLKRGEAAVMYFGV